MTSSPGRGAGEPRSAGAATSAGDGDDASTAAATRRRSPRPRRTAPASHRHARPTATIAAAAGRVGQRQPDRAAEPHRQRGRGRLGGDVRDPLHVGEQRAVEQVQGHAQRRRDLRGRDPEHPEPHHRRDRRRGDEVGRQRGERDLLEVERHQRRGGDRRGRGDRSGVRQRPGHAGAPQPLAPARCEREQPDDRGERELPPDLARRPRVECEREHDRQPERVPARRRPARQRGHEPGAAHHAGALDRRAAAGERDVDHDQRERQRQPCAEREPRDHPDPEGEHGQQDDVLARHRQQVSEARPLEVGPHRLRQPLVLAEHHPAQQRRLLVRQPARKPHLRPPPHPVERTRNPTPPRSSGPEPVHLQRRVRPAPSLERVVLAERSDTPRERDQLPDLGPRVARRGAVSLGGPAAGNPRPVRSGHAQPGDGDLVESAQADARGGMGAVLADRLEERRASPPTAGPSSRGASRRRARRGARRPAWPRRARHRPRAAPRRSGRRRGAKSAAAATVAAGESGPRARPAASANRTTWRGCSRTLWSAPRTRLRASLTPAPARAGPPAASPRCRRPGRAPRSSRTRRAARGTSGSRRPSPGRRRRARRAARRSRC